MSMPILRSSSSISCSEVLATTDQHRDCESSRHVLSRARLPILGDADLCFIQWDFPPAYQAVHADLQSVLPLGAMLTVPRLQREIRQVSRMAAECQRDDMVEFKVRHPRCIKPGFPEQLGLYCVGVATRWSNRLCVARNTDCLPDCFLGNVWVQRDAAVRGLNAGSILCDVGRRAGPGCSRRWHRDRRTWRRPNPGRIDAYAAGCNEQPEYGKERTPD